ncbi:cutinase [Rhodococcus gordoniae]|uniref:Cutinase n=1 Tax=Rhodococcus gordoniae TaxID=223392 RepID=A0A379M2S1_9NOCA|nr:cutinase family protein [Rhodococcus gordoniae]SUE16644.1 cutinase [Rhodococcus gordoniae]
MSRFGCSRRLPAIVAGLALGVAGPAVAAATAGAETFRPCPERFVLAVDGTRNIDSPDSIDPDSPLAKISARYAAPGTVIEHIRYPAVVVPVPESGSSEGSGRLAYDESKRIGHQRLRETITVRHGSCPDSELVVLGYSQGASIAGNVLAEIASDDSVPPDRISGVLYSDPRDTRGVETLFPGEVAPGITLGGGRDDFGTIAVERVCIEGDAVCDGVTPEESEGWLLENVTGYLKLHTTYPDYQP